MQLKGLTPTGMLPRYTLLGGQAGLQDGRVGVCLGVSVGVSACEWVGWSLCVVCGCGCARESRRIVQIKGELSPHHICMFYMCLTLITSYVQTVYTRALLCC